MVKSKPSDGNDLKREARFLLHDCDRSARYHKARRAHFEFWNQCILILVLFFSSAAAVAFFSRFEFFVPVLAMVSAILSAILVVWRPENKAYEHEIHASRFYRIYRSIDVDNVNPKKLSEWNREIIMAYEGEPPVYHAVNAEAYNAATQALGYKRDKFQRIRWLHRRTKHFFKYSPEDFPLLAHS